jgi:hypothetical protein
MEKTETCSRICELCGKTINYTVKSWDGTDWCGHQRGNSGYLEIGNECDCREYKRMCLNCEYYNSITKKCCNSQNIKEYNAKIEETFFDIQAVETIGIKIPTKCCNNWELDNKIAMRLFKK